MFNKFLAVFVVLGALAGAPVPGAAQDISTEPAGAIGLENGSAADKAIERRILSILNELQGYENVGIAVQAGVVTLTGQTLDAGSLNRLEMLVGRIEGVVAIENDVTESTNLVERLSPAYKRLVTRTTQLVAFIPLALVALTAFVLVAGLGLFIASRKRPWQRIAPNQFIADIYRQMVRIAFLVGGIVVALDILGATALLGTILGAAGIIGLAIGFAVKDSVENFIASIMLSIRQPFRPNDLIEIGGDTGKVIRLTSRATILLSPDGNHIRIPNATVFGSRIVNFTRNTERRFEFDLSVDPNCDLAAARQLCQDTVQNLPFVLSEPSAQVWIETLDDAGVVFRSTGWINQNDTSYYPARGEAIRHVKGALEAAGIALPSKSYTLSTNAAAIPADKNAPVGKAKNDPLPAVEDVNATDSEELDRLINAERSETGNDDLLSKQGLEE